MITSRIVRALGTAALVALVVSTSACGSDHSPSQQRDQQRTTSTSSPPATTSASGGATTPAGTDLTDTLSRAVTAERASRAEYQAVIDRLGAIAPFTNVLAAEEQHVAAITNLAQARGITLPPDTTTAPTAPATRALACQAAATNEQEVISLYGQLLPTVAGDAEATRVLTNLRDVSRDNHLPAFQNCS